MSEKLRRKGNSGVEARGEGRSGLAETTGDDRDGTRLIDARGGNWVYNPDHLGTPKKEIRAPRLTLANLGRPMEDRPRFRTGPGKSDCPGL